MTAAALAAAGTGNEQPAHRTVPALVADVSAAQRFAATRRGDVAFAVATPDGRIRGFNLSAQFRCASMTKAMLMVAVLRRAATRPLTGRVRKLLTPMITKSDNKAGLEVYRSVGDLGLTAVARAAGMRHFLPVGALFEARITAADQARLFLRIDRLVPARHRAYARTLLAGIVAPQRWGIASVARARHFAAFFKGGWRKGISHQAALLERDGRRVGLAVLTSGDTPQAYARSTLSGVATRVLAR